MTRPTPSSGETLRRRLQIMNGEREDESPDAQHRMEPLAAGRDDERRDTGQNGQRRQDAAHGAGPPCSAEEEREEHGPYYARAHERQPGVALDGHPWLPREVQHPDRRERESGGDRRGGAPI